MKKRHALLFAAALIAILLTGCGKKEDTTFGDTTNSIYLHKDLTVSDCMLYDFDTDRYDVDEYKGLLEEELGDYNAKHAYQDSDGKAIDAITIDTCSAKSDVLTQILDYYDVSDLVNYNLSDLKKRSGQTLESGTLATMNEDVLNAAYVSLTDEPFDVSAVSTGKNASSYRYLVCDFRAVLYGAGDIVAYSSNGVYTEDLNCVSAKGGETVVVIFK